MRELQQLAMPLSKSQIEAAVRFWDENGGWETNDINQLKRVFPEPQDAVRIKAIVLNALYGTNIIAISQVADCVEQVLKANHSTSPALVEEMVAEIWHVTKRHDYSFSAKYAHFFISPNLPILDWYAEWMVGKHLGSFTSDNPKRYLKFAEDIETLKKMAGLTCNCAELDAYLWVAGEYWYWKAHPRTNVSGELRPHFQLVEDPKNAPTLAALLGIGVTAVNALPIPL
jgi:hypothetical protein